MITNKKKQHSSIWVYENESVSTKIVRKKTRNTKIVITFFDITGHVTAVAMEDRRIVSS